MARHSDEELIRIIYFLSADYQPEALEAAKLELAGRNIPTDRQKAIMENISLPPGKTNKGIDIQTWKDLITLFNRNANLPFSQRHTFLLLITLAALIFFVADQWRMLSSAFHSIISSNNNDPYFYLMLFERMGFYLLLIAGLTGLYLKKQFGWTFAMMVMIYWSFSLGESVFISLWYNENEVRQISSPLQDVFIWFVVKPHLDAGWYHFTFRLILCGLVIYLLTFPGIKKGFGINKVTFNSTIAISVILFIMGLIIFGPIAQHHFI